MLVGSQTADDAGVIRLTDDLALVQTVDFITPVVDDPFDFGAIAAANALSDVYAMGATPVCALNLLANPGGKVTNAVLSRILLGGRATTDRAGAAVIGGHSVKSPELMFGLSVTGMVHPNRVVTNAGARPGDRLVLTKPLGVGIITTALKNEAVDEAVLARAVDVMKTLNRDAAEVMTEVGVHACTDITGFGFLGHLWEMVSGSGVSARIDTQHIPHFEEAIALAAAGNMAGGLKTNRTFLEPHLEIASSVSEAFLPLLFDPQTSGGLLMAVPSEKHGELLQRLREKGVTAATVGEIVEAVPPHIQLR